MKPRSPRHRQSGLGFLGLLFFGAIIAVFALVGMKAFPTAMEFVAVKRAVDKAAAAGGSATEIQAAFDRSAAVEDITSITGKDLVITKEGDKTVVSFAYEKRIPLAGPAILLLDYKGSSRR
jgi:hypothetical protein